MNSRDRLRNKEVKLTEERNLAVSAMNVAVSASKLVLRKRLGVRSRPYLERASRIVSSFERAYEETPSTLQCSVAL